MVEAAVVEPKAPTADEIAQALKDQREQEKKEREANHKLTEQRAERTRTKREDIEDARIEAQAEQIAAAEEERIEAAKVAGGQPSLSLNRPVEVTPPPA